MDQTLRYARAELRKYLSKSTGQACNGIALACGDARHTDMEEIKIDVTGGRGVIFGNNARAALLGVYRFLRELGFGFPTSDKRGEIIPALRADEITWHGTYKPANKHRGIAIEGAVSVRNVLDMVEWAPKAGLNSYFIQFRSLRFFLEKWYFHQGNETLAKEPLTAAAADKATRAVVRAIKKRGMLYHAVGHGWTCDALGIPTDGWYTDDLSEIAPSDVGLLAEINGKRDFFGGIGLNTQLCYGNPEARARFAAKVVEYAERHQEVDYLHVWLADFPHNHCECPLCRNTLPSDFYIEILNAIDAGLTERGLSARIVFLVYVELLWPPVAGRLHNPDRFVMMFAPITRTYTRAFLDGAAERGAGTTARSDRGAEQDGRAEPAPAPFRRNDTVFPVSPQQNLAYLRAWKKLFDGESFIFEYHLLWDVYKDFSGLTLGRVLYEDIRALPAMRLDGFLSCQVQRCWLPPHLMGVMAACLWGTEKGYDELSDEIFVSLYGAAADKAIRFLKTVRRCLDFPYLRGEGEAAAAKRLPTAKSEIEAHIPALRRAISESECRERRHLRHLLFYARLLARAADVFAAKETGNRKAFEEAYRAFKTYLCKHERTYQRVLDGCFFEEVVRGLTQIKQAVRADFEPIIQ